MALRTRSILLPTLLAGLVLFGVSGDPVEAGILATKHNLSISGPGTIKATSETRVCVFCHVPHNANPAVPLWGHSVSAATYTIYASTTIQGTAGQPSGTSKLCLACHDGAVAIGSVVPSYLYPSGTSITMTGTATGGFMPTGPTNLGTDLANDHPVSLLPASGAGADPEIILSLPVGSKVRYDQTGQVQCTSCHNPHDDTNGKFLVQPNVAGGIGSQLCIVCHAKFNWANSSHRNSDKLFNSQTIKAQACAVCHQTHTATIPARLLLGSEEALCNTCHNGSTAVNPAIKNVAGEFTHAYRHPLSTSGKHDPAETFTDLNDSLKRHSECEDCHNPHGAQTGTHTQGSSKVGAVLLGAWGMKPIYDTNPWTDPVSWEKVTFTDTTGADMLEAYLCFKCHKTLARDWNPNNPSFHAVMASRTDGTFAPKTSGWGTYINGWTATSQMACSDCHRSNNDNVKGPHGSDYSVNDGTNTVILFWFWQRADGVNKDRGTGGTKYLNGTNFPSTGIPSVNDGQLCFKCHDRRVYGHTSDFTFQSDGNCTGFVRSWSTNNLHIKEHKGYPCAGCHVGHGSNKRALLVNYNDAWNLGALNKIYTLSAPKSWNKSNCDHSKC